MHRPAVRLFLLAAVLAGLTGCAGLNDYRTEGSVAVAALDAPVKVVRDEKAMAFLYAGSMHDALRTLGYVTAQDRIFQMTLTRLFAAGRICELAGDKALALDARMRTLGFLRQARRHAAILDEPTRCFFQCYVDGINAYLESEPDTLPLEFRLAGIAPEPWTVADSLSILYYMSWDTSANLQTEIVAQLLVDKLGEARARQIFPLNINPDDEGPMRAAAPAPGPTGKAGLGGDPSLLGLLELGKLAVGSNNWAAGPSLSAGGKPIVCNDPHLDARMLPGPWYPAGIVTPETRIVGVHIPGLPLMPIFRNQAVAVGITNAYGDMQDLFVETVDPADPERYLEGDRSIAFQQIEEVLKIKDKKAPDGFRRQPVTVRLTRRGPVVSEVLKGLAADKVMSLRWAPFETMGPSLGVTGLATAESVADVRRCLADVNIIMLNFVFADVHGDIGWHVSGRLPIRAAGDGTLPLHVSDGRDNWSGYVPFEQMPHAANPARGWVGTCNHMTVPRDWPFYYSTHLSPSYRYRRLTQILNQPGEKSAADHWAFQRDTYNWLAGQMVPEMVEVLAGDEETADLARILGAWDLHDEAEQIGPTVFHNIYERFAWLTFADELGPELARTMLGNWYFWQERFGQMVLGGDLQHWFDDATTADRVEGRNEILLRAAREARAGLTRDLGADPSGWRWGRVHRHTLVSPIRREGFGKGLVGGGSHAVSGSVEALYRGLYDYNSPYDVTVSASLRMVADLADDAKVMAVLPGGVAGRVFHPNGTDQIDAFMDGTPCHWWFSDREIQAHTRSILHLTASRQR